MKTSLPVPPAMSSSPDPPSIRSSPVWPKIDVVADVAEQARHCRRSPGRGPPRCWRRVHRRSCRRHRRRGSCRSPPTTVAAPVAAMAKPLVPDRACEAALLAIDAEQVTGDLVVSAVAIDDVLSPPSMRLPASEISSRRRR